MDTNPSFGFQDKLTGTIYRQIRWNREGFVFWYAPSA